MAKCVKTKVCNGSLCNGRERPLGEFSKNKFAKDGFKHQCKGCQTEYNIQYYQDNKEGRNEYNTQYKQDYKEELSEYNKQYRQTLDGRYSIYKGNAKSKNRVFDLTLEQFEEITSRPCYYCGEYTEDREYCGIDRVDNVIGYVLANCISCCAMCNYMRHKLTLEKYITRCYRVVAHHAKKIAECSK